MWMSCKAWPSSGDCIKPINDIVEDGDMHTLAESEFD